MKPVFILILSISLFASCGPSAQEKARLDALRQDSIKTAQKATLDSINHSKAVTQSKIEGLQHQLEDINAQIVVEKDKLNQIGQFQFGRSKSKREDEIKAQSQVIFALRDSGINVRNRIQALEK